MKRDDGGEGKEGTEDNVLLVGRDLRRRRE